MKADGERRCPKCGGELIFGYGMAGGGCGSYELCERDDCDYFFKTQDTDDKSEAEAKR